MRRTPAQREDHVMRRMGMAVDRVIRATTRADRQRAAWWVEAWSLASDEPQHHHSVWLHERVRACLDRPAVPIQNT
jgi:hypothetical protein